MSRDDQGEKARQTRCEPGVSGSAKGVARSRSRHTGGALCGVPVMVVVAAMHRVFRGGGPGVWPADTSTIIR